MAERGFAVDHSTITRRDLTYAPLLNERIRCEMRHTGRSSRVDETYSRVAGQSTYLNERSTRAVTLSISAMAKARHDGSQRLSPACVVLSGLVPPASDERGWPSGVPVSIETTETLRQTWSNVPV
jgi:hypothetical protein